MKRVFRQILGWGMMLTLPLVMTSCEWFFDMLDNPITPALQVLRAQLTLKVGESKPIQASTQAHVVLLYSSDNPAVATIDATGLITAVSPGTARITIKAQGEDDYYRTEIFSENTTTVEVTVIPAKAAGSISFAAPSVSKKVGDAAFTNPLTIVGDGVATYESSNEEVATVDATTGEVTIVGSGTANITATMANGDGYAYETKSVAYAIEVDHNINLALVNFNFTAHDGDILTGTLAGNYKISIAAGASVELKDVTINGGNNSSTNWAGLTCDGNATITITGTNTVKGFYYEYPGIQAGPKDCTLTISGAGSLTATGGDYAAGIGSGMNATCGAITISGGTVNANSSQDGAGIGSGRNGSSCGDITISGGTVTASSAQYGAGIGSGYKNSSCKNITISGGTVMASSSNAGAGIGSGYANSSCGDISISGGDITASSSQYGAGIGSGYANSSCKNITISGGTIVATSTKDGAGIGSGYFKSSCSAISISGGTITAISYEDGAGIGSGQDSSFGSITITSDITKVQATTNNSNAWPIGKGLDDNTSTGAVTIAKVTVTGRSWTSTSLPGLNFATSSTGGDDNLTWTLTPKVP